MAKSYRYRRRVHQEHQRTKKLSQPGIETIWVLSSRIGAGRSSTGPTTRKSMAV